ncbi:TetR/AcrR family transcriptional regulator [Streptomyces sp. NBC_00335]|uniref:TetR/AcrR family transcriptional regulator n=1 Tax=unclassified Streptomyces TaxID=2593676 RepID=UPI00224F4B8E|nr:MULTISPECIES: TetR/AcrR family transcriptional regulator [unclassified Streptomyces]MCX5404502.1 TetR/AcrR family transcriptional regulator [Streptomyces sp. NBC_00086]
MTEPVGRRERKKAMTRKALADAALRLFLEHGYDKVGVRDVAEAADVSVTTLFKHFPSKEALVFDEDEDIEAALVSAVRDRAPGQSVLHSLREHFVETRASRRIDDPAVIAHITLVRETPELVEYWDRMWRRHEFALAAAIAAETGAPEGDLRSAALARFVMDTASLIRGQEDQRQAMRDLFDLIEAGFGDAPA